MLELVFSYHTKVSKFKIRKSQAEMVLFVNMIVGYIIKIRMNLLRHLGCNGGHRNLGS